jgi:hypothetical protein
MPSGKLAPDLFFAENLSERKLSREDRASNRCELNEPALSRLCAFCASPVNLRIAPL